MAGSLVRKDPLMKAAVELGRKRIEELEGENEKMAKLLKEAENRNAHLGLKEMAYTKSFNAFLEAVAVLAGAVGNKTYEGRKAREHARKVLADHGIRPPSELGFPRKVKKRGRKQRAKPVKKAEKEDTWLKAVTDGRFQKSLREGWKRFG